MIMNMIIKLMCTVNKKKLFCWATLLQKQSPENINI